MKKILRFRPIFYIAFLLFFALLPLESIREHSFCIYSNFFNLKCAGCGVTRAFCAFMHFDFAQAYNFNSVFTLSVFPLSLLLMLQDTVAIVLRKITKNDRKSILEAGATAFINEMLAKK